MTKKPPGASAAPLGATQQQCTCPSGDGSLRWPCPTHPPLTQQQGGEQEAVATVCLRGDTYAHGLFTELQVQHKEGVTFPIGTKFYLAPRHPADEGNK